jgi:riboflavin-specific deaminase-like protein
MSAPLDAAAAWRLVRAVVPGSVAGGAPVRVEADSVPDTWLEVDRVGSWTASGEVSEAARDVFDVYLPVQVAADLVIGQLGQSLDGRIATETGASHFVTGPDDIERLHRLRALVDAVVVGATTVASDDPRLTVRLTDGENPVRVVLDPSERVGVERRVRSDAAARTLLVRRAPAGADRAELVGDELHVPASAEGALDLAALLDALRGEGLRRILVEGGGVTVSRFLEAALLDRLHVTVAPMLIGSGRPSVTLKAIGTLDEAIRPACRTFMLGSDVLFDLDLRAAG